MSFAAVILLLAALVLILGAGPLAYDITGGASGWLFGLTAFVSVVSGFGCGTMAVYLLKELFS